MDHVGEPYVVSPPTALSYSIEAIRLEVIGKEMLDHVDEWVGDANAWLQFGYAMRDSFGKLVDRESFQDWELNAAEDWMRGTHSRTAVRSEIVPPANPANRGVLVAAPTREDLRDGNYIGTWTSEWHNFPTSGVLDFVAWDVSDATDRNAKNLESYRIEVRTRDGGNESPWLDLSTASALSYRDMGLSITAQMGAQTSTSEVQLRVTLDPRDPDRPSPIGVDELNPTQPSLRRIKVYYRLDEPTYAWHSLADVILDAVHPPELRSDAVRTGGILGSWFDAAFLEIPYPAALSGTVGERLTLTFHGSTDSIRSIRAIVDGYVSEVRPGGS